MSVSIFDISSYLPENRVSAEYFAQYAKDDDLAENVMFRSPAYRHHVANDESAVDMAERAVAGLRERHGATVLDEVDILLTHTQLPDLPFVGCGGEVANRLQIRPEWILDVHNGGCVSFVLMLKLVQQMMVSSSARSALIVNIQNAAGQIFVQEQVRSTAQASIPGDGATATLITRDGGSPVLGIETRNFGEFAGDMTYAVTPHRKYWEAGSGQGRVAFTEHKISKVLARGNRMVPEVALAVCDRIGIASTDLDALVTNQPNRIFLRNWRDALQLPKEKHPDTFDECGNLFGVGIPHTLDQAIAERQVRPGDTVMLAGFAHAGDYAAAAAVRWGGRGQ
ncbi:putative 3-oxoacyl-[acyl-carrier-protein] synthase [Mycobacteroides abscessus subsp. abscessus]|uniref:3-oxoacyl-[acyl-carrier-protein] synthase III family protein n=4 Tax=Mycobacteroides abscessus TaxID=36809 RepID=A0A829PPW4_9MYCO|nr:3-oxoacyl-[acyl-carrier-protein] synthase III C-terminal domain-containing protein [Mycobacteroides abscessus]ETZ89151.1 3-oxoacyl-[acyl-carrier-protein] synthase III family protein [Mycobacteroides abscessus MAB_030201_1075]ETZ94194.1 3-oxoacyl-[acyl-carrier-protein] synthase III family protein [Mycobacteroides abscessus MAB_030201_1061]EUA47032.1 3-oxoacyl-[acyl-carrier-protein] synthase III family protein [Mycobacteroides abscessus 21]AMU70276.1 3-oxoacyl-ACP synthase [Mycobacteroides abs